MNLEELKNDRGEIRNLNMLPIDHGRANRPHFGKTGDPVSVSEMQALLLNGMDRRALGLPLS